MRRSDRQITDLAAIRTILEGENHLHLGLADGGMPYVVPMSYGYTLDDAGRLTFYLHCADEGEKLDILRRNPRVCFEVSRQVRIVPSDTTNKWTAKYRSVIGFGRAVIEQTRQEKERSLTVLLRHRGYEGAPEFRGEIVDRIVTIRIEVESYTGKSNIKPGEEGCVR